MEQSDHHKHDDKGRNNYANRYFHESGHCLSCVFQDYIHSTHQSLGKFPDLSKFDLQTLQYNLTSVDGNSVPQFLQT